MSIFNDLSPALSDYEQEAQQIKNDKILLDAYTQQTSGVGLESLDASPAHQLIARGLAARYPEHFKLGTGNEALLALAAILGTGYLAYRKMMTSKNNPVLKELRETNKKINETYTADWIVGKTPVTKPLKLSHIDLYFAADNFGKLQSPLAQLAVNLQKSVTKGVDDANAAWRKIEPLAKQWFDAKDDDTRDATLAKIKALYSESPFTTIANGIEYPQPEGSAHTFQPLTVDEYPKAVALLKALFTAFDKIDEKGEILWMDIGFWDYFDKTDGSLKGYKELCKYASAEDIHDMMGSRLFGARSLLLNFAKSVEEWIVKSFK